MSGEQRVPRVGFQSLRLRVVLLVLLVLAPAVPLLLYGSAELREARVADAERSALRLARLASVEEDRLVEGARQLLTALARLPQVWQTQSDCSPLFATLLPELPQYANLGAALPDGTVYCSAIPVEAPVSVADRAYFQEALREKRFAVGTYRVGRISKTPTLVLAYPVLGLHGEALAVVFAGLDLAWLHELANGIELPPGGVVLVVERNGAIVAAQPPGTAAVGNMLESPMLLEALRGSAEGTLRTADLAGVDRIYGFRPLRAGSRDLELHVVVGLPAQAAFAEVDEVTRRSLLALAAFGLLGLAAAWFGGQLLVLRPVRALARTAARLERGDFGARTGVGQGTGELAALARSFDEMAESLDASSAALRTRADELEAIATSASALVRELDIEKVADVVVEQIRAALQSELSILWLTDAEEEALHVVAQRGLPARAAGALAILPLNSNRPVTLAARRREVMQFSTEEAATFPEAAAFGRSVGLRRSLIVPLSFRGKLVGVLTTGRKNEAPFSPDQVRLATALGDLFAAAVENARLFRQLQETLWLREAFIGAAAHELRTPATSLKSYTQLLLRRESHSDKERRTLTRMASLADRAAHLARELEEAHALARGLELRYARVDLRALVADALGEVQARHEQYFLMLCAGESVDVEADADRLSMSVEALLENAIRYQSEGGAVRITLERVGGQATVEVVDFGAGIPATRLPHVFEPLFEPWPPGSPYYTGVVGLGLYLARAVARAHGGELGARSEEGRGSVFLLTMPVDQSRP